MSRRLESFLTSKTRHRSDGVGAVAAAWLTALLDSHPRSVCRTEPSAPVFIGLESIVRRLQKTGALSDGERDRLVDEWTIDNQRQPPSLFFNKEFAPSGRLSQWWSWTRARWSDRARSAYLVSVSPADDQPYNLVLSQSNNTERIATVARGLGAQLFILRRHPGAVVASQLRGLRRGQLPPVDRVGWFEEHPRACRELELRLSSVLRMPIAELLVAVAQSMCSLFSSPQNAAASRAMQFEDFATIRGLHQGLVWFRVGNSAQTQALVAKRAARWRLAFASGLLMDSVGATAPTPALFAKRAQRFLDYTNSGTLNIAMPSPISNATAGIATPPLGLPQRSADGRLDTKTTQITLSCPGGALTDWLVRTGRRETTTPTSRTITVPSGQARW